jgi:hypothetical protein
MRRMRFASILLATSFLISHAACGGGSSGDDDVPAADAGTVDGTPLTFSPIIAGDWSLQGGQEKYWCVDVTLDRDLYIGAYRPIAPIGTHHTVLSVNRNGGSDNPGYECNVGNEAPDWLFASGVGTGALVLPDGVGVHLTAGTQIHLNLHLFNTGDAELTGHSGIEIQEITAAEVQHEAEIFLPGPFAFMIPGNGQPFSYTGTCTVQHDQTLVAIFPHMHQAGTHFKSVIERDGAVVATLWDEAYQFDSQEFANLQLIDVQAGDKVKTTCTWENNTGGTIGWGDSSQQEMCFSILMRYPLLPAEDSIMGLPVCTDEF